MEGPAAAAPSAFLPDPRYAWRELVLGEVRAWFVGREASLRAVLAALPGPGRPDPAAAAAALAPLAGNLAAVAEGPDWTLALVDKVRGYPLFFAGEGAGLRVSNSARLLREAVGLTGWDELSLAEFSMANYVTGGATLAAGLSQLQPGEFLLLDRAAGTAERRLYFEFFSPEVLSGSESDRIEELAAATDAIFARTAEDLAGRPAWLPLSAGLDSRLVAAGLKAHGHDNIQAFSYGPPGNYDARGARRVAEKLGVPWRFVPYTAARVREFFWSGLRREYWDFAVQLSSMAFMVDECAIWTLKREKLLPDEAVIINGQSGDFISGGHIRGYHLPALEPGEHPSSLVADAVLKKHYHQLKNPPAGAMERLGAKVRGLLGPLPETLDRDLLAKRYELWECRERQCKYVIHGQRSYDFFGHEWFLPLWDAEYLEFWRRVGYADKAGQRLYRAFLEARDWGGLFRGFTAPMWNWQGASLLALPLGRLAGLALGAEAKAAVYEILGYFGKYANHYAPFGFRSHLRDRRRLNGPLARYAELWLEEAGIRP